MRDLKRELTVEDFKAYYSHWSQIMKEDYNRIKASSEARKLLIKNIEHGDPWELLEIACECIYDLTGDLVFRDSTKTKIQKNKNKGV